MKTNIKISLALLLAACILMPATGHAKPEQMPLKSEARKTHEAMARQSIRNVDLAKIQDPEARKAIHGIMQYLKLKHKNQ